MNPFQSGWYLVYTLPRHEKKVFARLTEAGVESFLPTRKTIRVWHDRKKWVDEPLFPSYVFVHLNDMQDYYEGIEAEGALYYVKIGKEMARVQDSVVNNIKLVADNAKDIEITGAKIEAGQKLLICKGALTGLSCEVVQFNNKEMLLVRVDLLQRNVLVTLPIEHLMTV